MDGAYEAKPTWLDRARWRLFPQPPRPLITNDKRTFVTVQLGARLDWKDRLRTLLTGHVRMLALVYTDVEVKQAETRAVTWVDL